MGSQDTSVAPPSALRPQGPGRPAWQDDRPWRYRRLPTATVSTYAYVNPVVAVSLGALLLGEHLTPATVLGGAVVLASVALLLRRLRRRPGAGPVGQRLLTWDKIRV